MSDLYSKLCYVTTTISFWTKDQFSDLFLCTMYVNGGIYFDLIMNLVEWDKHTNLGYYAVGHSISVQFF
jgi:hypothetical protein